MEQILNKEGHELLSEYIYYFGQQDCNKMIKPRLFTAIPCEVAEIHVITVF